MSSTQKTAIVTGASQGSARGIVKAFVERGFNVVANSRKVTQSTEVAASTSLWSTATSASRRLPPGSSRQRCLASSQSTCW
jgi:NAD(P)-dependent dehydrogenase (short-subunit alcohol dehydrogenase family)